MTAQRISTLYLVSFLLLACDLKASTLYVDGRARGTGDGSSWQDAIVHLGAALEVARPGDEIRVAGGVYRPDERASAPRGSGSRHATFRLKSGVTLRGGYAGLDQPEPDKRCPTKWVSILSGDLAEDDGLGPESRAENSYHVVTGNDAHGDACLDGFTITAGNADGDKYEGLGGGVLIAGGSPKLTDCRIRGNRAQSGGGAFIGSLTWYQTGMDYPESQPVLEGCTFEENEAADDGGGLMNKSAPRLVRCVFTRNRARWGGGLYESGEFTHKGATARLTDCRFEENYSEWIGGGHGSFKSWSVLVRCTFISNHARNGGGGAIYACDGEPTYISSRILGNRARQGGGIHTHEAGPRLINCVFSGNGADSAGGGASFDQGSSPRIVQSTFSGNSAQSLGGGIFVDESHLHLANSILSGNRDEHGRVPAAQLSHDDGILTLRSCCIPGATDALGGDLTIRAAPGFVDPEGPDKRPGTEDDDLRLEEDSPCIDRGDATELPADEADLDGDGNTREPLPLDFEGQPRRQYGKATKDEGAAAVDVGAIEYAP